MGFVVEQPEIEYVTGNSPTVRVPYRVLGAASVAEARALLFILTAASRFGLVRRGIRTSEAFQDDLATGTSVIEASIDYGEPGTVRQPVRTTRWAFEISGKSFKITQSRKTIGRYGCKDQPEAPDEYGAINVTHDGIEGCEMIVPDYTVSRTFVVPAADMTSDYKRRLFDVMGKTNLDKFEEFEPGEALFVGVSGSARDDDNWDMVQRFAASPNVADACEDWPAAYKPTVPVPKKGWEYLWCRYADDVDDNAHAMVKRPVAVYIERIYKDDVFSSLLPGGAEAYTLASDYFANWFVPGA